ncbi:hypothetical protein N7470_007441 [Penicillium chermesinum]|nr:hypothetical protein N7470_007441 [Penicillium chermesinum]
MNSLNILSSRVIGQSSNSTRPRSRSQSENRPATPQGDFTLNPNYDGSVSSANEDNDEALDSVNEKTSLLHGTHKDGTIVTKSTWRLFTKRIFDTITETIRFILSTVAAPGVYLAQCFQDDDGRYSLLVPIRRIWRPSAEARIRSEKGVSGQQAGGEVARYASKHRLSHSQDYDTNPASDDTPRRSIRIKLHNEEVSKRQRQRRSNSGDLSPPMPEGVARIQGAVNLDSLKSPTSPSVHRLDKYPHSPTPPRPLLPQRVPSYTASSRNTRLPQKTLVLDLDETLIHSLAKGGRMSSGHMVEVKLSMPMTTALTPGGPQTTLGPQHPILYYVHKRPHCDDFLRKICKWYKLVIFTASVQEYADPVIDWLEQERKYFQARYYRQHCTLRNGAYIKDLSSVEPDLSKVMILDNSPMSYIFHEDNAIPIEGWINDPTDNGLLHLVPMLEALQYATDVRALLALRRGEVES